MLDPDPFYLYIPGSVTQIFTLIFRYGARLNPTANISNLDFYKRYRFCKQSVHRLANLVFPEDPVNNRGLPFTHIQVVCSALHYVGGASFQRTEGVCAGSSTSTAHKSFYTFASALQRFKPYIVHMPTREIMEENAREVWNKHHIYNVIGGIDGSHVRMECLTRQMPDGMDKEIFRNRKGWYSLNVLVFGGYDHRIYDLVVNAPGSFHDSAIFRMSMMKPYIRRLYPKVQVLGDSAFALTDTVITPYSGRERNADIDKALFNHRHSKARLEMTEHIYGIWKKRFPIIGQLRQKLENCFVVVETTAILHNLSILWEDILPREMDHDLPPGMALQHEEPEDAAEEGAPQNERRLDGERIRDGLKRLCSQTPPTAAELRKIRIRR